MFQVQIVIPDKKPLILAKCKDLLRIEESFKQMIKAYPNDRINLIEYINQDYIVLKSHN